MSIFEKHKNAEKHQARNEKITKNIPRLKKQITNDEFMSKILEISSEVEEKEECISPTGAEMAKEFKAFGEASMDEENLFIKKFKLSNNENISDLSNSEFNDFSRLAYKLTDTTQGKGKIIKEQVKQKILMIGTEVKEVKKIKQELKEFVKSDFLSSIFRQFLKQIKDYVTLSDENHRLMQKKQKDYCSYLERQTQSLRKRVEDLQQKEKQLQTILEETDNSAHISTPSRTKIKQSKSLQDEAMKMKLNFLGMDKISKKNDEKIKQLEYTNEKLEKQLSRIKTLNEKLQNQLSRVKNLNQKLKQKLYEIEDDLEQTKKRLKASLQNEKKQNEEIQNKMKSKFLDTIQKFSSEMTYFQEAIYELKLKDKNENKQYEIMEKQAELQEISFELAEKEKKLHYIQLKLEKKEEQLKSREQKLIPRIKVYKSSPKPEEVYFQREEKDPYRIEKNRNLLQIPRLTNKISEFSPRKSVEENDKMSIRTSIKTNNLRTTINSNGSYNLKKVRSAREYKKDWELDRISSRLQKMEKRMKSELFQLRKYE